MKGVTVPSRRGGFAMIDGSVTKKTVKVLDGGL